MYQSAGNGFYTRAQIKEMTNLSSYGLNMGSTIIFTNNQECLDHGFSVYVRFHRKALWSRTTRKLTKLTDL